MDRMQLTYAILQAKFPKGYRTQRGATYAVKLRSLSDQDLKKELFKLNPFHPYFSAQTP